MLSCRLSNASRCSAEPQSLTCVQTYSLGSQENHGTGLQTARKQAIAAASFAFERASERGLAAQDLEERNIGQTAGIDEQVGMEQRLGRKQSIRFTGLTAVPIRSRSITRRVAPENKHMSSLPDGAKNGSYVAGRHFSAHPPSGARTSSQSKGNPQELNASSSAPLRRLKRARSMFVLRGSATNLFSDNRPSKNYEIEQKPANLTNNDSQLSNVTESHLRRSFSFLSGEKDDMASGLDTLKNQSAAAQLARKQYFRELEEKSLRENSPSLIPSHNYKFQKAFRKSVRSSSKISYDGVVASPGQARRESAFKKALGYNARSLSFSLKQKLKHIFQRHSDLKDTIPIQQLDASRLHFRRYPSNYARVTQEYHQVPSPDSDILRKARSRESNSANVPGFPQSVPPTKSIRSDQGENGSSHLFASWPNATSGHILAATQSREKRLSVIQEHGGSCRPSSNDFDYAYLAKVPLAPIRKNGKGKQIENAIDSQNIFSALQQKIDEKRRLAPPIECFREEEVVDGVEANTFQPQGASLSIQSLTGILAEAPESYDGINSSNLVIVEPIRTGSVNNDFYPTQDRSSDLNVREDFYEMYSSLTPRQIAVQNETGNNYPKRPLREIKAAFFPSSMHIERTNVSPYRRLMGSGGIEETGADSELEENTPLGARSESALGSASIYSRTSSGNTPNDNKSSTSLTKSESSHERGKSVVIKTLPSPQEESTAPCTFQISRQSRDCQGWMGPEMSQPGNRRLGDIRDHNAAGKENRHKSEHPRIDDDDMDVSRLMDDTYIEKQGFGFALENATPQPDLRHHTSGSMFRRSPLLEIGQSAMPARSEQCSSSPPCQPSTPRRSVFQDQEISSFKQNNQRSEVPRLRALNGTPKSQGRDPQRHRDDYMGRHSRSISAESIRVDITQDMPGTLTPTPTPTRADFRTARSVKSQGYNSPERLARIRRLQNSNSLASQKQFKVESNTGDNKSEQNNKELIGAAFKDALRTGGVLTQSISSTACKEAQFPGVRNMVDSFLSSRRRKAGVNEDNGIGPAFL